MKMLTLKFILFVLSVIILLYQVECDEKITIFKCCGDSEKLNNKSECVKDDSNQKWAPNVYSAKIKKFFDPGSVPDNFVFVENKNIKCKANEIATFIPHNQSAVLDNGKYYESDRLIDRERYCVAPQSALVCRPKEPKKTQIKKCCGQGALYSEKKQSCVFVNKTESYNFLSENIEILPGFPICPEQGTYAISGKFNKTYSLNVDGTLRTSKGQSISEYCVERFLEQPNEDANVFTCQYKIAGAEHQNSDIRFTLYPIALFISVIFLTITLIASCMLPSTYHALHWKCQTHHVACLLFGDLLLALTQTWGSVMVGATCVITATAMHFLFLSAFFWLNTMCFNIWWTFRDLRPTSLDKGQEACRLKLYQLYAWGVPLIIVSTGALMDQVLYHKYPSLVRPKFGQQRCWFYGDAELFVYFFGPVGLLLLVNLLLFAATTRELTCGLWKREVVKSNTERTTLGHVCLKLVIVMGITWIVDVLSWAIGGPDYVWYLTDIVNSLQGVLIFIVVGCQPQVWASLKRLWCLSRSSRSMPTSTSNAMPSIINDQSTTKPVESLC